MLSLSVYSYFFSCKEVKEDLGISDQYLKCSFGEDELDVKNNKDGWKALYINDYSSGNEIFRTYPQSYFYKTDSDEKYLIRFVSNKYPMELKHDEEYVLNDLFQKGTYPYMNNTVSTAYEYGVAIEFTKDGVIWKSINIDQPNSSSFIIEKTKYKRVNDQNYGNYIKVSGMFNCLVSDENGNTRIINNATFKLNFSAK